MSVLVGLWRVSSANIGLPCIRSTDNRSLCAPFQAGSASTREQGKGGGGGGTQRPVQSHVKVKLPRHVRHGQGPRLTCGRVGRQHHRPRAKALSSAYTMVRLRFSAQTTADNQGKTWRSVIVSRPVFKDSSLPVFERLVKRLHDKLGITSIFCADFISGCNSVAAPGTYDVKERDACQLSDLSSPQRVSQKDRHHSEGVYQICKGKC